MERARRALAEAGFRVVDGEKRLLQSTADTDLAIVKGALQYREVEDFLAQAASGSADVALVEGRAGAEIEDWAKRIFDNTEEAKEVKRLIHKVAEPCVREQERRRREGDQAAPGRLAVKKDPRILILALAGKTNRAVGYLLGKQYGEHKTVVHFSLKLKPVFVQDGVEESVASKLTKLIGLFKAGASDAQERGYKLVVIEY